MSFGQSWPLLKIECPYSASLRFHKLSSLFAWKENFDSICFVRISYAKQIQCASIFLKCGICSTIAIIVRSDCQIVTYMNESSHRTDLLSHLIQYSFTINIFWRWKNLRSNTNALYTVQIRQRIIKTLFALPIVTKL